MKYELNFNDVIIDGIFPTPVYITKLNRTFTTNELKEFDKHFQKQSKQNEGNLIGVDTYILNRKPLQKLKKEIDLNIQNYFNKVIKPSNKIKPYITQSWLNWTSNKQFHHTHEHPNSIVSGVLYISADEQYDKIKFFKNRYAQIAFEHQESNLFNSGIWSFPVKTGMLLLFPSHLTHRVDYKEGSNLRISLAFNTFVKGIIGNERELTELYLK
jgi:uncharacterized protein (TIGR02466 family)